MWAGIWLVGIAITLALQWSTLRSPAVSVFALLLLLVARLVVILLSWPAAAAVAGGGRRYRDVYQ